MELEGSTADSALKCLLTGTETESLRTPGDFLCVFSDKTFNSHEMLKFSFCPL